MSCRHRSMKLLTVESKVVLTQTRRRSVSRAAAKVRSLQAGPEQRIRLEVVGADGERQRKTRWRSAQADGNSSTPNAEVQFRQEDPEMQPSNTGAAAAAVAAQTTRPLQRGVSPRPRVGGTASRQAFARSCCQLKTNSSVTTPTLMESFPPSSIRSSQPPRPRAAGTGLPRVVPTTPRRAAPRRWRKGATRDSALLGNNNCSIFLAT